MRVRLDIAVAVARARAEGVAWKLLQRRFRLSRSTLAEAGRWGERMASAANESGPGSANVSNGHLGGCADAGRTGSVGGHRGRTAEGCMQGLFGGPKLPAVQPPPPIPTPADPAVEQARKKALIVQQTERGRSSTRLTSATGVTGQGSNTLRQTLGGA